MNFPTIISVAVRDTEYQSVIANSPPLSRDTEYTCLPNSPPAHQSENLHSHQLISEANSVYQPLETQYTSLESAKDRPKCRDTLYTILNQGRRKSKVMTKS